MNRRDRRRFQTTAKIIKSAGLVPTHWFWVGEGDPPAFDKDRIADWVLNKKMRGETGTCRFHTANRETGKQLYFAAVLSGDGELLISVCDTEERAKAVYAKIKPSDAEPILVEDPNRGD